jgi:hypothetical protein
MVGELPQKMIAAECGCQQGLGFAKHACGVRVEGLRLAQIVVGALPLRVIAAGCGMLPGRSWATDEIERGR